MRSIKTAAKKLRRRGLIPKALAKLARLKEDGSPVSRRLTGAIRGTLEHTLASHEREWIDRIEALRRDLLASRRELALVDYGAGGAKLNLTAEQMYRGRTITRTVGEISRRASKSPFWSLLLFRLLREFKPRVCLELGTALGLSAAYQAAALTLNGQGHIVTLEGAEPLARLAREHFDALGLANVDVVTGRFQDTLAGVLQDQGPLDHAFIDGHHDGPATVGYADQIMPALSGQALLVFDDISWSDGMRSAWRAIASHDRVKLSMDLSQVGICIVDE